MIRITKDFIEGLLELGGCINNTLMRHDIDVLDIKLEPEYGYVYLKGMRDGKDVFEATHYGIVSRNKTNIKIAPQDAATSTGARQ